MSKSFRKTVKNAFIKALSEKTAFSLYQEKTPYIWASDVVFYKPQSEAVTGFIVLSFDPKCMARFTIEIGWSLDGHFPRLPIRPSGRASRARSEFQEKEFITRLATIWEEGDMWWGSDLPPENDAKIFAMVDDAVGKLLEYGIPYLEERANM